MDTSTFDLYRILQSGPYDEAGLNQVKRLLGGQRRVLRGNNDLKTLEELIPLLQDWAAAAGGGWLSASALAEAAEIAEIELRNTARAEQLRSQAIVTGRAASGLPAPLPESLAMEGAVDANAELLHELKTLPPGALTQTLLTEAAPELEPERESSIPRPRSTPAPFGKVDPEAGPESSFPAPPRSTPAPFLRAEPGARRASSVPVQRRPSVPTLTGTPALKAEQLASAVQPQEHTQEMHTIDLELHALHSAPPAPANDGALSAEITRAEQALESDTSPDRVRELAELFAKRDAPGDREQAAELFTTLGEVLGHPAGIAMLERALALVPEHAEAKAQLMRYAVRPRVPLSPPKITVLGTQPRVGAPLPPPPAAAVAMPRIGAAGSAAFAASASLSAAADAQLTAASLPPRASLAPTPVQVAARSTLRGPGPVNDVLPLHGVPQVFTTPPAVPQISSLTPIVRSDASQLHAHDLSAAKARYGVAGGVVLTAAAAFGLFLSMRAPSNTNTAVTHDTPPQAAAASQPLAQVEEAVPVMAAMPAPPTPTPAPTPAPLVEAPAPLAPPAPSHLPRLVLESAQLRGGKLSEAQLTAALGKAEPKLLACYAQAVEKKPRIKGRVIYGFSVRTNGRATNIKRVGGTLRDEALLQCSAKVLETVRFPKPRKQSSQVKLPIQYKRS